MWYRFFAYIKHCLTAWNTGGEGIHSPYLFYLVRMLFYDENRYYCFKDIEYRRSCMLRAPKKVYVEDLGTGKSEDRLVSDIAATSLESPKIGQLLFRIVSFLGHDEQRPLTVVELGTSLGITTAYLAAPDSRNIVTSFEGAAELVEMAKLNASKLHLSNIRWMEGNIDEELPKYITGAHAREEKLDLVFIDANHTYEATMRYFKELLSLVREKTIIAIDDIHYSPEMNKAWREIQTLPEVTTTIDLFHIGLVFFDKHYINRHYKLKI